ncbi:hypothetical protein Bhyg_17008, partial [Pseudolycoriella hygida]
INGENSFTEEYFPALSIRASQIHKVPRKTLRNWMKRWHIKSAFPMPRQLKQAAENKKLKKIISDQLSMSTTITMNRLILVILYFVTC